jgi:hypothetical protein
MQGIQRTDCHMAMKFAFIAGGVCLHDCITHVIADHLNVISFCGACLNFG